MSTENIVKLEVDDQGIAVVTMNNPKSLNAFDDKMSPGLISAFESCKSREDVKVVIVTGSGRAFSSGGDIAHLLGMDSPITAKNTFERAATVVQCAYELEKPVIAAVNGPVAGAATALMMACDLIIAAENARVGFTFINIAYCPDSGCSYFLTRKVGHQKAAELLWFGKIINASEALQLGLVNTVVAEGQALAEALEWAQRLIQKPLMTVGFDKMLLRQSLVNDLYQQANLEGMYQVLTTTSHDFKEGCNAFLEKRKPVFKGC